MSTTPVSASAASTIGRALRWMSVSGRCISFLRPISTHLSSILKCERIQFKRTRMAEAGFPAEKHRRACSQSGNSSPRRAKAERLHRDRQRFQDMGKDRSAGGRPPLPAGCGHRRRACRRVGCRNPGGLDHILVGPGIDSNGPAQHLSIGSDGSNKAGTPYGKDQIVAISDHCPMIPRPNF